MHNNDGHDEHRHDEHRHDEHRHDEHRHDEHRHDEHQHDEHRTTNTGTTNTGTTNTGTTNTGTTNTGTTRTALLTPSGFGATASSATEIDLTWVPPRGSLTGYELSRNGTTIRVSRSKISYQDRGLTSGTTYTYTLVALGSAGKRSQPTDPQSATTLPNPPTGLQAQGVTMSEVDLTWNTSPEKDVAFYLVYRDGASVAKISSTLTNWKDTGLKPATYSYQLRALDTFNQMSDYSTPPVSGSPDTTAPSIPANFTASTTFPTSITLNWTASIDPAGGSGLEGYLIIRDGKVKIPVSASPTTYTDKNLQPGTSHTYTIQAFDKAQNYSLMARAGGSTTIPPPP